MVTAKIIKGPGKSTLIETSTVKGRIPEKIFFRTEPLPKEFGPEMEGANTLIGSIKTIGPKDRNGENFNIQFLVSSATKGKGEPICLEKPTTLFGCYKTDSRSTGGVKGYFYPPSFWCLNEILTLLGTTDWRNLNSDDNIDMNFILGSVAFNAVTVANSICIGRPDIAVQCLSFLCSDGVREQLQDISESLKK